MFIIIDEDEQFLTLSKTSPGFYVSAVHVFFLNTVEKGDIAHNEQFLLFPQCFLPFPRTVCHFHQIKIFCLQTLLAWKSLKFVVWESVDNRFALKWATDRI